MLLFMMHSPDPPDLGLTYNFGCFAYCIAVTNCIICHSAYIFRRCRLRCFPLVRFPLLLFALVIILVGLGWALPRRTGDRA